MVKMKEWLLGRARDKQPLYQRYAKPLEEEHKGEYLAVGPAGETILGKRAGEVLREAVESFGSRNFALLRVGHTTFGSWLCLSK